MINSILDSGLKLSIVDGRLSVRGSVQVLDVHRDAIRQSKPELLKILAGETVDDVGECQHCGADLLGLRVHGSYVNRVCGDCGEWATCLPPGWSPDDLAEYVDERAAIMEHDGKLSRDDADREAVEAVRSELEEQKSIFASAERIEYDSKSGRQPGRADDRVTQLLRS